MRFGGKLISAGVKWLVEDEKILTELCPDWKLTDPARRRFPERTVKALESKIAKLRENAQGKPPAAPKFKVLGDGPQIYDNSLPKVDTSSRVARLAQGVRRMTKPVTTNLFCFHCGVEGAFVPGGSRTLAPLQMIEGLEEHVECVSVKQCEIRIVKDWAA